MVAAATHTELGILRKHAVCVGTELLADQALAPEPERDVLLERRHHRDDALALERGHAPFDLLLDLRAAPVHEIAHVLQDWPCEVRGLRDVGVNGGILHAAILARPKTPKERPGAGREHGERETR